MLKYEGCDGKTYKQQVDNDVKPSDKFFLTDKCDGHKPVWASGAMLMLGFQCRCDNEVEAHTPKPPKYMPRNMPKQQNPDDCPCTPAKKNNHLEYSQVKTQFVKSCGEAKKLQKH